jgi:hypothetical protein
MDGVTDTVHGHNDVAKMLAVLFASNAFWELPLTARVRGKCQGLANCQHGKVNIDLSGVDGITTMGSVHLPVRDALVVEVGIPVDVDTISIARDGFQKSRATGPRRTQNHAHLPWTEDAIELL